MDNLIHVAWSQGEYRDLGSDTFPKKTKGKLERDIERTLETSHTFTNCGNINFPRGKGTDVSNLLCYTPKIR